MAIFFIVVFTVYFAANTYIYLKGYALAGRGRYSAMYTVTFLLLVSMFIAGKILERNHSGILSDILNIIGGFWLAYMLYAVLLYIITDLGLLAVKVAGISNGELLTGIKKWRFIIVNGITVLVIVAGFFNALAPRIVNYEIETTKSLNGRPEVKIAAVSDIHLGSTIRKRSMRKLQSMIGSVSPDMVLFLGDIVDGEIGPVLRGDLLASFSCPPCREGVYAITGNHEYIGGIERTAPYILSKGIELLDDETVTTPSGVVLIGRRDRDSFRYTGKPRATLDDLLAVADRSAFTILLDHQPVNPGEAAAAGIDLQLSGHTHNGQIWPLSIVVSKMYEIPYGLGRIGETSVIVSSGFGLWGPRVRIGSRPEIVVLRIKSSS